MHLSRPLEHPTRNSSLGIAAQSRFGCSRVFPVVLGLLGVPTFVGRNLFMALHSVQIGLGPGRADAGGGFRSQTWPAGPGMLGTVVQPVLVG